jgi:hypothetical protein
MTTKIPIEEKTFIRSVVAKKGTKTVTSFMAHPYITGMYVCIEPGTVQLSLTHKGYAKWAKDSIKKMEASKLKVTKQETKYVNFISKEEIEKYELL